MVSKRNRTSKPLDVLGVVIALFLLCVLIVVLRIEDLYDVVRYAIIAIVAAYLGWRGGSRTRDPVEERDDQ